MKLTVNTKDAEKLLVNLRTWSPKMANKTIVEGVTKIKTYAQQNIRPHNRTGKLHDSMTITKSPKQYSAWLRIDARNERGPYAQAVEFGGRNPRTGGQNRPVRYLQRAIDRYAKEQGSTAEKNLRTIPKK